MEQRIHRPAHHRQILVSHHHYLGLIDRIQLFEHCIGRAVKHHNLVGVDDRIVGERQQVALVFEQSHRMERHLVGNAVATLALGFGRSAQLAVITFADAVIVFCGKDFAAMFLDEFLYLVVLTRRRTDSRHRLLHIGRQEQHVVARLHGLQLAITILVVFGHTFHIEAVGKYQAIEPKLLAQKPIDEDFGERDRTVRTFVVAVDLEVGGHNTLNAGLNHSLERIEVDRIDISLGVLDKRKIQMAVSLGVAVTGEMLGHGYHLHLL